MSFFGNLFGEKKGKTVATTTPEQDLARQSLAKFLQTGTIGPYTAGAEYNGPLGDFNMSTAESVGQSKLLDLIHSALPSAFTNAQNEYQSVLDGKYDPYNDKGVYQGYKTQALLNQKDAVDALNRQLSVTGDTYSTNRGRSLSDLYSSTNADLSSKLGALYQDYSNQRLNAAGQLLNSGIQEEGLNQGRINLANTVGSLPRLLQDAQAKAKYADFLRQQQEKSSVINAANTLFNNDQRNGATTFQTPDQPSTFMSMLGEVSPLVGSYNQHEYGYNTNQTSISQTIAALTKALSAGGGL